MAIRFTDNLLKDQDGSDFIVRGRKPLQIKIFLIFLSVFLSLLITATLINAAYGKLLFFTTLTITIGALGWFTVTLTQRNRDLVLATEFQNAMLASAAQLSTNFCLITKRDGTIVYVDPGFQKIFPKFLQGTHHTIDKFLMSTGIAHEVYKQVSRCLENETNGKITLDVQGKDGTTSPMIMTIDVLPRPQGYYLFRGRNFVEKRVSVEVPTQSGVPIPSIPLTGSDLLAEAFRSLPEAVLIADDQFEVIQASALLEEWLGYETGEFESHPVRLERICYQYEGHPAGKLLNSNFQGTLTLQRKNRTLATFTAYQTVLEGRKKGISICLFPQGDESSEKKKLTEAADCTSSDSGLADFIASSPIAVACIGADGKVIECNQPLRELAGLKVEESGWNFIELVREDCRADVSTQIERMRSGQPVTKNPLDITLATEETTTASLYLSRLEHGRGGVIVQIIDTTEQKNLEQRFAHSQKMQAVGQLAGGVAHDFNNLLTAMIGFCDLLLIRHPAGDQSFADIMQIKQNANRAANLVRQLLAFSRRQTLQPKMLDVTDVLAELSNLIRRLIGENIELKVIHGRDLGVVKADQGQLEQVFINLAVNARDAMQNGGNLTIQTSHVTVDRTHPISRNLVPPLEDEAIVEGDYVLVEVIDTGTGIPRKLLQKIFEPFFSTKEVGSGTGLGLATVYGIIKQTGGYIYVSSKEGSGTTFSLFFKRYQHEENKAATEPTERAASDDLTGKGTILLVEDETPVRTFAARALRNKGYTVLEADCGENAIEVMDAQGSEVDVIISDVIMPGINGPSMIDAVAPKFPRVKVIFISGYAEDIFVKNYGTERTFNFLPKPFTLKQLASKVKEVIQG